MKRAPRGLRELWDTPGKPQIGLRRFITRWVNPHRYRYGLAQSDAWDLADQHWLLTVRSALRLQKLSHLSGPKLTREAERVARQLLNDRVAMGLTCALCDKIDGSSMG